MKEIILQVLKLVNQVFPSLYSKKARIERRVKRLEREYEKLLQEYYNALAENDEKTLTYLYYRLNRIRLDLGWLREQAGNSD